MYCLCSIESATRQVLLCDKKIVVHVQSFIISRIHQRYILSYRKLKQCLPSGEPPGWPMSTTRASPPRWQGRPSRLALSRWGNLHDFIIMFTSVKSQPSTSWVECTLHWLVSKSQEAATKREITSVKFQKWDSGKPVGAKFWAWGSEAFSLGCSLG